MVPVLSVLVLLLEEHQEMLDSSLLSNYFRPLLREIALNLLRRTCYSWFPPARRPAV